MTREIAPFTGDDHLDGVVYPARCFEGVDHAAGVTLKQRSDLGGQSPGEVGVAGVAHQTETSEGP